MDDIFEKFLGLRLNDENEEYYFYACGYMAKTELYDRSLTNCRCKYDTTEAFIINPLTRKLSTKYALQLKKQYADYCGGLWQSIQNEIRKHQKYSAQKWIDEYNRLLNTRSEDE